MAPTRWDNREELTKIEPDFEGMWGNITSTMNWCEAKYEVLPYFAEFWNTISNLVMIIPPLFGIFLAWRDNMELRFMISLLSLAIVGIGSWFFHMTLIYETQLLDELPMLYGSLIFVYTILNIDRSKGGILSNICLIVYGCVATTIYLKFPEPELFQIVYGILVISMVILGYRSIEKYKVCRKDKLIYYASLFSYAFGFFLWQIDVRACSHLKSIRSGIGYPIKPIFQLHAWWHIWAGTGTYVSILYVAKLRALYLKEVVVYERYFFWAYLRKIGGRKVY